MLRKYLNIVFMITLSIVIMSCSPNIPNREDPDKEDIEEEIIVDDEIEEILFSMTYENGTKVDVKNNTLNEFKLIEKKHMDYVGFEKIFHGYSLKDIIHHDSTFINVIFQEGNRYYSSSIDHLFLMTQVEIFGTIQPLKIDEYFIFHDHEASMEPIINNIQTIEIKTIENYDYVLFDYKNLPKRYDYYSTLRTIQGIVNKEKPNLFTIHRDQPFYKNSDERWKMILENMGYTFKEIEKLEDLVVEFKDYFQGIITFSDHFKSYNQWVSVESDVASMIAGRMNYLPVPNGLQGFFENITGIPYQSTFTFGQKEFDGNISNYTQSLNISRTQEIYSIFFDDFKEEFHPSKFMSLTSEALDYAVSEGMMFFDLKATQDKDDRDISTKIFQYFLSKNDYFDIYGWVDQESEALDLISSYGGIINVVGGGNLSFFKNKQAQTDTFKQKTENLFTYDEQKKYVTFMASESDTIKVSYAFQHGAWNDPYRGQVPVNWGMIADISEDFPFIYEYFINQMSIQEHFYSGGGSALGFVDIDIQMPLKSRQAIAMSNKRLLNKADQQIIDMYNDKYTGSDSFDKSILGAYFMSSQINYAITRIHDGNTSIRLEYWRGIPVYNRWSNFYPRRPGTPLAKLDNMERISEFEYVQNEKSEYWFFEGSLENSKEGINFGLFKQSNGDGYELVLEDGYIRVNSNRDDRIDNIYEKRFHVNERNFKITIENSKIHDYPRIQLILNDLKVLDIYDRHKAFTSGGFSIKSTRNIETYLINFNGSNRSIAMSVYDNIIRDSNQFIIAYYGFMGTSQYEYAQYRSEPGIGDVMSLSSMDIHYIIEALHKNHPNQYQITHLKEFMEYAGRYFDKYQTLR
jgi:hypothetical protein